MNTISRKNFAPVIKSYLLEVISNEDGMQDATEAQKVEHVSSRFNNELGHEMARFGTQQAFVNWLQGLALDVEYYNYKIEDLLISWGVLDGTESETKVNKAVTMYWDRLAVNMLQLIKKHSK